MGKHRYRSRSRSRSRSRERHRSYRRPERDHYDDEKKAAVDYTSAIFKFRERVKRKSAFNRVLSDDPPQPPIPKSSGRVKEGASKYTGVSFDKRMNKWRANYMLIEGKQRFIGYYDDEEEAAVDYARAVFKKYKGVGTEEPKETETQSGITKKALMSDPNVTVRIDEDGHIDVKRPEDDDSSNHRALRDAGGLQFSFLRALYAIQGDGSGQSLL